MPKKYPLIGEILEECTQEGNGMHVRGKLNVECAAWGCEWVPWQLCVCGGCWILADEGDGLMVDACSGGERKWSRISGNALVF